MGRLAILRRMSQATQSVVETPSGFRLTFAGHTLELAWYGPAAVRVRRWQGSEPRRPSFCITGKPARPPDARAAVEPGRTIISGGELTISVDGEGALSFARAGRTLLAEKPGTLGFPGNHLPNPEDRFGAEQTFELPPGEALYGLGQFQDGVMNWRGRQATLIHGNTVVAVPFILSTSGWGMLWDNPSHTEFSDGPGGMRLWSEVAEAVDYTVCAGADADAAIAGYRLVTGSAPLFPRAFYGVIQCKERYKTAAELVEVVREHRRRKLPLDVIVQDWQYWGPGMDNWSGMRHDPATYGDLPAAIGDIHAEHAKVMISIWPRIGKGTPLGRELEQAGHLFAGKPQHIDKVYDAFSEEARAIYWRHTRDGLFNLGIDAWWMDGTEPEFEDCHVQARHKAALLAQRDTAAGSWARVLNAYSIATTRGVYENQRRETDAKRVFILTRSAYAGQQSCAAATWSGDISATWETFARQVPAGLNFCMSGIPYWTTDNGAFFVCGRGAIFPKGVDDPAFREFFLRWFQYSCFCPLMRSHGTQTPREIWHFGQPGETIHDSLVNFARLRMRLLPYTYSLAAMTTFRGYTPMRGMGMDFPGDPKAHGTADQFMYGPALMACPVTEPMVHLPGVTLEPFGTDDLATEQGGGRRMRVFDGLDATQPADEQVNRSWFDHNWSGNLPRGAGSASYRVEFAGRLKPRSAGPAAMVVRVAGLVRVELAGETVVDGWKDAPLREYRVPIDPVRHREAELRVTYGHLTGDALVQVGWELNREWSDRKPRASLERNVYLPGGAWYDFWTGRQYAGERTVAMPSPLDRIPVMVRAGSILPLGPHKQWQDEAPDDPVELRVYPGADGRFTLYEDAGDGYAYERGEYSEIEIEWDDRSSTLTLHGRRGSFAGMPHRRTFHVVKVREGHGAGIDPEPSPDQIVQYDGSTVTAR